MTGVKDHVYRPNKAAAKTYAELYGLYRTLHDAFGTHAGRQNNLCDRVMKDLIAIRDNATAGEPTDDLTDYGKVCSSTGSVSRRPGDHALRQRQRPGPRKRPPGHQALAAWTYDRLRREDLVEVDLATGEVDRLSRCGPA